MQGNYYHVLNKGLEQKLVFVSQEDLDRFADTLSFYQVKNPPSRFSFRKRLVSRQSSKPPVPMVEIICFCLMPNRFHLLLNQLIPNGISIFLSKVTNSYSKYFNAHYKRKGPLFQGTFKSAKIENDNNLINISRHIHLNPILGSVVRTLKQFPYSSYPEYAEGVKGICKTEVILQKFPNRQAFEQFTLNQTDYQKSLHSIQKLLLQ